MPCFLAMLLTLIVFPPSRSFLFPPAPLAAVSSKTGTLQTPKAGTLGSSDSLTGAPEAHKGQAVEQEASNFVTGFGTMAVATVAGKSHERDSVDAEHKSDAELAADAAKSDEADPVKAAEALSAGRSQATGKPTDPSADKTKVTQQVIWEKARPFMRGLEDAVDTWECIGNALSPTPPYSSTVPRLKLAGCIAPVFLMSLILPSRYYVKGLEVIVGLALFTQPLTLKGLHWLNENYPDWPQALELRKYVQASYSRCVDDPQADRDDRASFPARCLWACLPMLSLLLHCCVSAKKRTPLCHHLPTPSTKLAHLRRLLLARSPGMYLWMPTPTT